MSNLLAILLSMMLLTGLTGAVKPAKPAETAVAAVQPQPASVSETETAVPATRLEGPGSSSPEEAVLACIDAMNRGDADGMIATFAIESFAERADPAVFLEHNRGLQTGSPYAINGVPRTDGYAVSLIAQVRYGIIASDLISCYSAYAVEENHVVIKTAEELENLTGLFRQSPLFEMAGKISFVRWISPAVLTGGAIVRPAAGGDIVESLDYTGADDLTEIAAQIRIGDRDAILALRCVRYGGRWYNLDFNTRTLALAGVTDPRQMVLWIPEGDRAEVLAEPSGGKYAEEAALWDALQQSEWAGTRWPLVSLNIPGASVHDSAAAAENDGGIGVWAEVHFSRVGGAIIRITVSPALQELLKAKSATGRIRFSWSDGEIPLSYLTKKGKSVPLFRFCNQDDAWFAVDGLSVVLNESTVTFTLADGTQAVFRKPDAVPAPAAAADEVSGSGRLEGPGYDSPEDAAMAYIDAMNRGNVREMLATFALESFADHADPLLYDQRLGSYDIKYGFGMPVVDDYGRALTARFRYAQLANSLLSCYVDYATALGGKKLNFDSYEEIVAFLDQFPQSPLAGLSGNVSFTRWLNPVNLTEGFFAGPYYAGSAACSAAYYGAEDIAEPVAQIEINGRTALMGICCVRYNGRWYNLELGNTVMTRLVPSDRNKTHLWLPLILEQSQVRSLLRTGYPEENARWDAIRQSGLGGTRLVMVALEAMGVAVHENAADAAADSAGIHAEIRFFGNGSGLITVTAGPALQKQLGMDSAAARFVFAWQPGESGGVVLQNIEPFIRNGISLATENITAVMDGSAVTLTLPHGMRAVFDIPR